LAQHLEYLPFGEVFVDERATPTTRSTPYKFNAKELDEETGLYYYGARYMDPRLSLWLSVDPLAEKYPGVGSYVYCYNNPVKFVDPDGRAGIAGAIVGGGLDYGFQVGSNLLYSTPHLSDHWASF
jgi:RHS repeat-associated protein